MALEYIYLSAARFSWIFMIFSLNLKPYLCNDSYFSSTGIEIILLFVLTCFYFFFSKHFLCALIFQSSPIRKNDTDFWIIIRHASMPAQYHSVMFSKHGVKECNFRVFCDNIQYTSSPKKRYRFLNMQPSEPRHVILRVLD